MKLDTTQDLYAILGVSSRANAEDIKRAYRAAARRFHPDANPHEGAGLQFRDIVQAYEILNDTEARNYYDRYYEPDQISGFSLRSIPSKRVLPILEEAQVIYLLLEIEPRNQQTEKPQHPLNIALILDRSSSMRGARLDRVKVAAHQIIDQMNPSDRISIITFSDRANTVLASQSVQDKSDIKALINSIVASGGTEIYQGLAAGYEEVSLHFNRNIVNHLILITDGRTYGDEEQALELADEAREIGIGISAMGIGEEWNDEFLDELASRTGGTSAYINSPTAVVHFLEDRVRTLGEAYAERMQLTVAPDADVKLETVFRLQPNAQPLNHDIHPIQIGALQSTRPMLVLLQFQMPPKMNKGFRTVARLDVTGDVLGNLDRFECKAISDQSVEISQDPPTEDPPPKMLDALGKLTLYRMQQKAEDAVTQGQVVEATRRLQNLATRLLEMGHADLAEMAHSEARRVAHTRALSEGGRKALKFGTRLLLAPPK